MYSSKRDAATFGGSMAEIYRQRAGASILMTTADGWAENWRLNGGIVELANGLPSERTCVNCVESGV